MIKMFILQYVGKTFSFFRKGESYIGRVSKKGDTYAFNEKGYWSPVSQRSMTINRLEDCFVTEKTFYVDNYKEALSYPVEVDQDNWGVDFNKILSGAKFTFEIGFNALDYVGQFIVNEEGNEDVVSYWHDPISGELVKSYYNQSPLALYEPDAFKGIIGIIKRGMWIITSIEDN